MGEKLTEHEETLDRIWCAIEEARCPNREGPYGLYDYGSMAPKRHRVRDFRDPKSDAYGEYVLCTDSREDAVALYQKLTRHHIAAAARRAALSREEGR